MKKVMFTAFVVGLGLTANLMAQVPSYVPSNGLVGWWPFNANANDESGNGNNGTVNGATLTTDRINLNNYAYSFSGNEFISIPNSNTLNSNYVTISVWFQTSSLSFGSLVYKTDPSAINEQYGIVLNYPNPNNSIWSIKNGNNCNSPGIGWQTLTLVQNLSDSIWHNLICTYDGTLSKIYLDNNLISNSTFSTDIIDACGGEINIGKGYNSNYFYSGKIDDIGIWNRALTQDEITALYNGCSGNGISLQPNNVSTSIGNSAQFIVNSSLGATYQWQTDLGVGFQNLSNAGQYSGTNNDTLVVSNLSSSNNNQQFRCVVNSESCIDTSNIAILTVSTVDINEIVNENFIVLFPNPASDHITIDNGNYIDMAGYTIKIENNAGQQVFQSAINQQQFYVDLSTWSGNGLYFVHLIDAQNNTVTVRKIVLQ